MHVAVHNETRIGDRQVAWGKPTAHFPLDSGDSGVAYIRLSSVYRYPASVIVSDQAGWTRRSASATLLRGLQGGITLLLVLTCLALAWSIREHWLLLLAAFTGTGLGRGLIADGSVLWLLGDHGQAAAGYVVLTVGFPAFGLLVRSYAAPGQLWRWLDAALKWLILPFAAMLLTYLVGLEGASLAIQGTAAPISIVLILLALGRIMMNPTKGTTALAVFCGVIAAGAGAHY